MLLKVTNNSKANQGIWTTEGLQFVAPGKSEDLDIADDYLDRAKSLPFFKVSEAGEVKAEAMGIEDAILSLDATDDKQWTNAGLPAVDAISALVGRTVTRAEINEVAPDFMRPASE